VTPSVLAISLDLDDTLWEVAPVIRRAEDELWAWLAQSYPRIVERFSETRALELRQQLALEHANRAHDFRFLRLRVLAHMASLSGYAESVAEEAFEVFDSARNRVELFPDVEPALERLAGRYRIVALTNGNASLEKIGIDRYFHGFVSAAAGVAKPDPGIFATAVEQAGVPAERVLHVGDHPEFDVAGAARAGLRTAWINRRGDPWPEALAPPNHTVTSMSELHDLLISMPPAAEPTQGG